MNRHDKETSSLQQSPINELETKRNIMSRFLAATLHSTVSDQINVILKDSHQLKINRRKCKCNITITSHVSWCNSLQQVVDPGLQI